MTRGSKKPRVETIEEENEESEREEALIALIEHRTKEVDHLKKRLSYYQSQLEEAEKKLHDSESQLARLRLKNKNSVSNGIQNVKLERRSASPINIHKGSHSQFQPPPSRPQLIIPAVNPKVSQPIKLAETTLKASIPGSRSLSSSYYPAESNTSTGKLKGDTYRKAPLYELEIVGSQKHQGPNWRIEQKEHKDLIPSVCSSATPCMICFKQSIHICSQHKRKLRSLALNPVNDELFVTSALDGIVSLWQLQSRGSDASLLSTTDCVSPKQRRWPEDVTWHPHGHSLFSVYSADGGDSQISILNLNSSQERRVTFLEEKPHVKGIINSIVFMPWQADLCFATGGCDHAVVLWNEKDGEEDFWKPKPLHRNLHTSAVMGVAGLQQKQVLLSVGTDKRIIGFDLLAGRADYKHQIESKCMSVLPNPSDFNLFMVQAGAPQKQLRLFDIRMKGTEIHAFGWKQESESQSALINQAWSPDGWYVTSGSADPKIHIFDIRYNSLNPSQSVKAHQKRVFRAVWHHSLPLLISISSDLQVGLHNINGSFT